MHRLLTTLVVAIALAASVVATRAAPTEAQLVTRAEAGDVDAMLRLGFLHYLTVEKDGESSETLKWYRHAAAVDSVEAMMQLSHLYGSALKNHPNADAEAKRWNDLAISTLLNRTKQGDLTAEAHLAYIYDLNSNSDNAMAYYRDAAEKGSAEAMFELGAHYKLGWDVQEDNKESITWLTKAANKNNTKAMLYLSDAYEKGLGVAPDAEKAEYWSKEASKAKQSKSKNSDNVQNVTFSWPED